MEELSQQREVDQEFEPKATQEEVDGLLRMWHKAVERALDWAEK